LEIAQTWIGSDGVPVRAGDRVYTPHKVIRRQADHLIDHLAEVMSVLAGRAPQTDRWHASELMSSADVGPFGSDDFDEARERLTRLAALYEMTYLDAGPLEWDMPRSGWTLREIAEHLSDAWYAEQIGPLQPTAR
jgi:hypothetical protein